MESFEIKIGEEYYRISRSKIDNSKFSIFNHTTCHIVKKSEGGLWSNVEHRFGSDSIPMQQIGEAIDRFYNGREPKPQQVTKAAVA